LKYLSVVNWGWENSGEGAIVSTFKSFSARFYPKLFKLNIFGAQAHNCYEMFFICNIVTIETIPKECGLGIRCFCQIKKEGLILFIYYS